MNRLIVKCPNSSSIYYRRSVIISGAKSLENLWKSSSQRIIDFRGRDLNFKINKEHIELRCENLPKNIRKNTSKNGDIINGENSIFPSTSSTEIFQNFRGENSLFYTSFLRGKSADFFAVNEWKNVVNFSPSTGKEVDKYPEGKPSWEHLQHICIRLSETWPQFFTRKMDYTIYRDDVLLEDRVNGSVLRGVHRCMQHFGLVAFVGRILHPQIEMKILHITPIIENATVRMRWRVYRLSYLDILFMLLRFKPFTGNYLQENGRIVDGYSIFYADSHGAVYRHIIDRVLPDDDKSKLGANPTLLARLKALLGAGGSRKQTQPDIA